MARVPDVVGLTEQEARGRFSEAGFGIEVGHRETSGGDVGKVLEQPVPAGKEAEKGSKIEVTVGEASESAKVPDLVGLSYPDAEDALKQAGFLLGGVKEATSESVPAGAIMKQGPPPGTKLDTGSYVYLTTSVGPPEQSSAAQGSSATSGPSNASSEVAAVEAAVRGHYEAIGEGNLAKAYSYFGPTFRSQQDEASWISGEETYEVQSSTIHYLHVDEITATTATATVDVSFVDNTGTTPRFLIVWGLVKEGGQWKLDQQYSGQRID